MIRRAEPADCRVMVKLFSDIISRYPDYISHGEIQMGIAIDSHNLKSGFESNWENYLVIQMQNSPEGILVWDDGINILGFVICIMDEDLSDPFGVISDLCVDENHREKGIGRKLLQAAVDNLSGQGIKDFYLESGLNNHSAHNFFEKHGFKPVSKIFRKSL